MGEEAGGEKAPELHAEHEPPRVAVAFSNGRPFEWTRLAASHTTWRVVGGSEVVGMWAWRQ